MLKSRPASRALVYVCHKSVPGNLRSTSLAERCNAPCFFRSSQPCWLFSDGVTNSRLSSLLLALSPSLNLHEEHPDQPSPNLQKPKKNPRVSPASISKYILSVGPSLFGTHQYKFLMLEAISLAGSAQGIIFI